MTKIMRPSTIEALNATAIDRAERAITELHLSLRALRLLGVPEIDTETVWRLDHAKDAIRSLTGEINHAIETTRQPT